MSRINDELSFIVSTVDGPLVGIVVPTLGVRNEYLLQSLASIRKAGQCFISIVTPKPDEIRTLIPDHLFDSLVQDPMLGLPTAINTAIYQLPKSIAYVNWLGDDDLLTKNSLKTTSEYLDDHCNVDFVYGKCAYIDMRGDTIWTNQSGVYAQFIMRIGPQLVPQPGALFRRKTFTNLGGLNPSYKAAFDLDLFLRFQKIKRMAYIPVSLASFRWHESSISVRERRQSIIEASQIRQSNLPRVIRLISLAWEYPIRNLIYLAGKFISFRESRSRR